MRFFAVPELTLVVRSELGADLVLVNGIATSSELFFAVAAFRMGHALPPVSLGAKIDLLYLPHEVTGDARAVWPPLERHREHEILGQ
jgi:hypothetical protein